MIGPSKLPRPLPGKELPSFPTLDPDKRAFEAADKNRDNGLSRDEFIRNGRPLPEGKQLPSEEEQEKAKTFARYDRNEDGKLSFAEFKAGKIGDRIFEMLNKGFKGLMPPVFGPKPPIKLPAERPPLPTEGGIGRLTKEQLRFMEEQPAPDPSLHDDSGMTPRPAPRK